MDALLTVTSRVAIIPGADIDTELDFALAEQRLLALS